MNRDKLYEHIGQMPLSDETKRSIMALCEKIIITDEESISLDEADILTVLKSGDSVLTGSGRYSGKNASIHAMHSAIQDTTLSEFGGKIGAALIHFRIHPDISMLTLERAMEMIEHSIDQDASIIFGAKYDETIGKNSVEATLILTGTIDKQ